jgi:hypothetical protein
MEALRAADGNSSLTDLARTLEPTGTIEEVIEEEGLGDGSPADYADRGQEHTERLLAAVSSELEDRRASCGGGYPFSVSAMSIKAPEQRFRSVYVFLLLLANKGIAAGPADLSATELFEEVAAEAGRGYFGGPDGAQHYQFGFPRRRSPAGFRHAMTDLCRQLGEGGGPRTRPTTQNQKDAKLDLVVWRPFPDGRAGKMVAFGQCAAGADWTNKLSELDPRAFMGKWMTDPLPITPSRLFFCPVRITRDDWLPRVWDAGLIFDRCRIALHAQAAGEAALDACERFAEAASGK